MSEDRSFAIAMAIVIYIAGVGTGLSLAYFLDRPPSDFAASRYDIAPTYIREPSDGPSPRF
jgi:hypothetical protein